MKIPLIVKLLSITLAVSAFMVALVWVAIDTLAAGYFVTLMKKYHISPEPAHDMFVHAVHRYLVWAFVGAVLLAAVLSFLLLRTVLKPLTRMTLISEKIAAGDFSVRVPPATGDEVGQLARAFNRMAEGLEKLEKLRRDLMIDVAHELRTPLTNIRGYLEALVDRVLPPSPQTLTLLMDETMRLAGLVEDVLQLARADAAHGHLRLEPFDMKQAIDRVLAPFGPTFKKKALTLALEAPPEPLMVLADPDRMVRGLRNLVDNMTRYSPGGSQLGIRLEAFAGQVVTTFSNPAGGLRTEDLPFVFERFYRGEKSRSREHGGAGIGLAIVKELVEAHGGSIAASLEEALLHITLTLPINS